MALPLVRGSAQALYPFTKRIMFDTGVTHNSDATEQRWKRRAPLWEFEWSYNALLKADAQSLVAFFDSMKGAYGTFSFTLGASTFSNLNLVADVIEVQQNVPLAYGTRLMARQTQNRGWTAPSWIGDNWPTFSSGAELQYPYGPGYRMMTTGGASPTGTRYASPWWGNGLSGQPNGPLRKIAVQMTLPDTDAALLEQFFCNRQGRLTNFSFSDPFENLAYYKMRFESDTLEMRYLDVNQMAVSLLLTEVN